MAQQDSGRSASRRRSSGTGREEAPSEQPVAGTGGRAKSGTRRAGQSGGAQARRRTAARPGQRLEPPPAEQPAVTDVPGVVPLDEVASALEAVTPTRAAAETSTTAAATAGVG